MKMLVASLLAGSLISNLCVAAPTFFADKTSWLTATRADLNTNVPLATPTLQFHGDVSHAGPTRVVTFTSTNPNAATRLASWGTGLGAPDPNWVTRIATDHPATSAGFLLRVGNNVNVSVGGPVLMTVGSYQTTLQVPAGGGLWVSFTLPEGFTGIDLQANGGVGVVEMVEDVNIGDMTGSANADQVSDAPVLALGPTNSVSVPITNTWATADPFPFTIPGGSNYFASNDVWLRVAAPADGTMRFATQPNTFDTVIAVYDVSNSLPIAGTQPLAFDDDSNGGLGSRADVVVAREHVYAVRIAGYNGIRGSTTFTASLISECRGDFNHDGSIDFFDYLDFVNAFSAGC